MYTELLLKYIMTHFKKSVILRTSFYDTNQKILMKKGLFPKFHLIPILRLQVIHDCVLWHCSIDHCV